jgi:hypothetical protein
MTSDPCGGDVKGGAGCNCPPPFASDVDLLAVLDEDNCPHACDPALCPDCDGAFT